MRRLIRSVALASAGTVLVSLGGCAGGRVYEHGINHVYLCTVRVVRAYGYQVRQQDFRETKGKLVAARSTPDPLETPVKRGFFGRAAQVVGNVVEQGKLEFYDDYLAGRRIRTDKRVVAKFKSSGFLGWRSKKRTKVKLKMDVTDYGREDWVIHRDGISKEAGKELYVALKDCLVSPGWAGPPASAVADSGAPSTVTREIQPSPTTATAESGPAPESGAEAPAEGPVATPVQETAAPVKVLTPEELEEVAAQGRKAYESGDFKKTIELLNPVIAADPGNAEALGYLGAAYYQSGRRGEAIGMYERYVEIVPSDLRTREFLKKLKDGNSSK